MLVKNYYAVTLITYKYDIKLYGLIISPEIKPVTSCFNQELLGYNQEEGQNFLVHPGILINVKTRYLTKYQ